MLKGNSLKFIGLLLAIAAALAVYPPIVIILVVFAIPQLKVLFKDAINKERVCIRNLMLTLVIAATWSGAVIAFLIADFSPSDIEPHRAFSAEKAATAIVLAPFFEEFIFRYLLLTNIRRRFGNISAILTSSIIFGLIHKGLTPESVLISVGGIFLSITYLHTGSIINSTAFHSLYNASLFLLLFMQTRYSAAMTEAAQYNQILYSLAVLLLCFCVAMTGKFFLPLKEVSK